jgi:hypothetical protein
VDDLLVDVSLALPICEGARGRAFVDAPLEKRSGASFSSQMVDFRRAPPVE